MRFHSLSDWLNWQESLHFQAIDLGLERCRAVAERMGLLPARYKVISIAGTNGKGTSAAMLDKIYQNAGYSVGTYTSPHLLRYNERIRINGREATDAMICEAFQRVDQARSDITLTYFEFGTLAAMELFRSAAIDLGILEVGMGGRLDAVNILDADVALITAISLDHQQWLGSTREQIGREKAGIMRPGRAAVCSDPAVPDSIIAYADEIGAQLYLVGRDFRVDRDDTGWDWRSGNRVIPGFPATGIFNNALVNNTAGVLMAVELLGESIPVDRALLPDSLNQVAVPGRFQVFAADIPVILDVAHNPQAAEILAKNLADQGTSGETHMVIGMLDDKDHRGVLAALSLVVDHWYIVSLAQTRGTDGGILADTLKSLGHTGIAGVFTDVDSALDSALRRARVGDRVVVSGSFLTVGEAIRKLSNNI